MSGTRIWLTSRAPAAEDRASGAGRRPGRSRRAAVRLWALLHAQALLRGTTGGRDTVALIEDDCRRLAARRQTWPNCLGSEGDRQPDRGRSRSAKGMHGHDGVNDGR